ncbi:MAG: LytTR family DNA-binding domain-containing protein [Bacteroidota bacterium]
MKPIHAIIVDDEAGCIETLRLLLENYHPDVNIIGTATSMAAGLLLIGKHKDTLGLLFLDIQMPGGDGFTLLQRLPEISFKVIFTTAYDIYAIRAIKFSALDYLLKPIDNTELHHALDKLRKAAPDHEIKRMDTFRQQLQHKGTYEKLAVSTLNDIVMVEINKVIYLESDNNYTTLHLDHQQSIVSSKNIGYYEDLLHESRFFRIHNSYIINLKKMNRYLKGGTGQVEMDNGTRLLVSTRRREEFVKYLSII